MDIHQAWERLQAVLRTETLGGAALQKLYFLAEGKISEISNPYYVAILTKHNLATEAEKITLDLVDGGAEGAVSQVIKASKDWSPANDFCLKRPHALLASEEAKAVDNAVGVKR